MSVFWDIGYAAYERWSIYKMLHMSDGVMYYGHLGYIIGLDKRRAQAELSAGEYKVTTLPRMSFLLT